MQAFRLAVAALGLLLTVTLGVALITVGSGALETASASSTVSCSENPVTTGTSLDVNGLTHLSATQIGNAQIIESVGRNLGVPIRGRIIAVATALQESTLRTLPQSQSDGDSIGLFQQRPAWGSAARRLAAASSAEMFYTGGDGGQSGLLDIDGWQHLSLTAAAQAVQASAHPDAYASWETLATRLVGSISTTTDECATDSGIDIPNGVDVDLPDDYTIPTGTPTTAAKAIKWAVKQLGTWYFYGGTCTSPHSSNPKLRCDCSSLVQQAYKKAGISLPRTTGEQKLVGTPIYSVSDLQAGDLIFLDGHVGIYMGSSRVIHAPQTGEKVKVSNIKGYWTQNIVAMRRVSGL